MNAIIIYRIVVMHASDIYSYYVNYIEYMYVGIHYISESYIENNDEQFFFSLILFLNIY